MRSAKLELSLEASQEAISGGALAWTNPVMPGDHPDPTIVQVDGVFWASATSGEWSPQFPLFRSTDLREWTPAGAVFPVQPLWAEGSFWAPELVHDEVTGRFCVWYVGRKRGGSLCIAVATAETAAGPYTDHGPLICEEDGSIDPCFARDEDGRPYLIWKEDGNSVGRPTPIWAQALTPDLLELRGTRTQLIVNDQPWEEGVVEGPYLLRHEGQFYLFYAGNSCCGKECKYAEGVARAQKLLGPWEKFAGNPIIGANDNWRCPGHGTAVHTDGGGRAGQDYFLYHAYPATETIYVGREAVLDAIMWRADGWPEVNAGRGPGEAKPACAIDFADDFTVAGPGGAGLGASWQWPVNTYPLVRTGEGGLRLVIPSESSGLAECVESAMVAVPRPVGIRYEAQVLLVPETRDPRLWAGLAVVGDPFNTIGLGVRGDRLVLWQRRGAMQATIWEGAAGEGAVWLRVMSAGAEHRLQFCLSKDGLLWEQAGRAYDASDLPAWDRGLRIGLLLEGPQGMGAGFREFRLKAD